MLKTIATIVLGLGMALVVGSLIWGSLFPATRSWTNEKSDRMGKLGVEANLLGAKLQSAKARPKMHGGENVAEIQAQFDKVNAELAALRQEFEGKRDSPKTMASIFRWAGIACVAVGAMVMMASRNG